MMSISLKTGNNYFLGWHNNGMGGSVSAGCLVYSLTPLAILGD